MGPLTPVHEKHFHENGKCMSSGSQGIPTAKGGLYCGNECHVNWRRGFIILRSITNKGRWNTTHWQVDIRERTCVLLQRCANTCASNHSPTPTCSCFRTPSSGIFEGLTEFHSTRGPEAERERETERQSEWVRERESEKEHVRGIVHIFMQVSIHKWCSFDDDFLLKSQRK